MQLALIVDDSKTARVMLRKMLDRLQIPVAMVESAEEALVYLENHHPDVIFMDHMMPGMDGFSAVKVIKSDPKKSTIPIVMHTTKQGDIYLGQARALGAADILSKPASDQTLVDVLERVKSQRLVKTIESPVEVEETIELVSSVPPSSILSDSHSTVATASPSGVVRRWLLAVAWVAPILLLLVFYFQQQNDLRLQNEQRKEYLSGLEWLLNRQAAYDYGEMPMSGQRLDLLRGLVNRLKLAGFKGVIRLEGYTGEFCLSQVTLQDGSQITMLPRAELPLSGCDVIGSSQAKARQMSVKESEEFKKYRQEVTAQGDINIELVAFGTSNPKYAYPVDLQGISSGDWNTVALNNNRVQFGLIQR